MMDSTSGQFEIPNTNDSSLFPGHIIFSGSAPTPVAGTGAGTSPTLSLAGVDNGGLITLTTGTLPAGSSATITTVTFANAFPTDTAVVLTPANLNADQLSGSGSVWANGTASNFTLNSGSTGLIGSTQYIWNYVVIGW